MRRLLSSAMVVMALGICCVAEADPMPAVWESDIGILVPIDEHEVDVLDQHLTITLPAAGRIWEDAAVIRSEYVLSSRAPEPVTLSAGWPTGEARRLANKAAPEPVPFIKWDGKPVGCNCLTFNDLAEEYVRPMLDRIAELVEARPALRDEVRRLQDEREAKGEQWRFWESAHQLADWLVQEKLIDNSGPAYIVAMGLLGVAPQAGSHERRDYWVQYALQWLDPTYRKVDVFGILSDRWGHDTRLLQPDTGQLVQVREGSPGGEPIFSVFRFSITLEPWRKHHLVAQYGQFLGGSEEDEPAWAGLVYIMTPAERWGYWYKTTIEIKVPAGWDSVAIRPPAKKVATAGGVTTYRIVMRERPCENLYVSARPRPPAKR